MTENGKEKPAFRVEDYLALHGCKELSEPHRELIGKQVARIINFVTQIEQAVENSGSDGIPEIELDELDERLGEDEEEE